MYIFSNLEVGQIPLNEEKKKKIGKGCLPVLVNINCQDALTVNHFDAWWFQLHQVMKKKRESWAKNYNKSQETPIKCPRTPE